MPSAARPAIMPTMCIDQEKLMELLRAAGHAGLGTAELARRLRLRAQHRKRLREVLRQLELGGQAVELSDGRWA